MKVLFAFLTAALGVLIFKTLDLPLPWLLGPIFACLAAALLGIPLGGIKVVNESMRTILGVAVGATMTPAVIATFPSMWPTLLLVVFMVAVIGFAGVPYFRRVWGYDFATAYYSTMPGGLQDMLVFGEEAGGNVRTLSLIHATRVLVIVVALPFILKGVWNAELSNPPGLPLTTVPCGSISIDGATSVPPTLMNGLTRSLALIPIPLRCLELKEKSSFSFFRSSVPSLMMVTGAWISMPCM